MPSDWHATTLFCRLLGTEMCTSSKSFARTLALLALLLYPITINAEDRIVLRVIVASTSHTEVLTVESDGDAVNWTLVTPQDKPILGTLRSGSNSIESSYNSIVKMQSDESQRNRVKSTPFRPTFSLMFEGKSRAISMPLTPEEHQALISADFLQSILLTLNERKALRKPYLMLDFFSPNRSPEEKSSTKLRRHELPGNDPFSAPE